ncbi:MAG TPA: hypothetical protein VF858_01315 [Gemmatimonadaceae bacterium]
MKISTSQSPIPEDPENNNAKEDRQQELSFYEDDLVARVRAAKEAAQREMESFGDVSEYEIRKIYGRRTDIKYDDEDGDAPEQTEDMQAGNAPSDEEA